MGWGQTQRPTLPPQAAARSPRWGGRERFHAQSGSGALILTGNQPSEDRAWTVWASKCLQESHRGAKAVSGDGVCTALRRKGSGQRAQSVLGSSSAPHFFRCPGRCDQSRPPGPARGSAPSPLREARPLTRRMRSSAPRSQGRGGGHQGDTWAVPRRECVLRPGQLPLLSAPSLRSLP